MSNKIFVVVDNALGDHLCSTVMLRNMKKKHPNKKIIVSALHPELFYGNPNIDDLYPAMPEFFKYRKDVYKFGFEHSYSGKLSRAWCEVWGTPFDEDKLEYYITDEETGEAKEFVNRFGKPIILIAPHGGCALKSGDRIQITKNKDWFAEGWEELCAKLRHRYTIIQVGTKSEPPLYNVDKRLLGNPLRKVIALIPHCKLWISVDSFLQHAGSALNKKGIVLFGKTNPSIFGHDNNINIYKKVCPLEKCHLNNDIRSQWNIDINQCASRECMKAIRPKEVLDIINHWDNEKYIAKKMRTYQHINEKLEVKVQAKSCKKGRVEIEIPTCDRHGYLGALLANLRYQTYKNWDITIIDDGADESIVQNQQILNTLKSFESEGHRWRLIRGIRKGPPIAHQRVLDDTEHEFALIIGDDCLVPPDYLEKLYGTIVKDKNIAAVGGICVHLGDLGKVYPKEYIEAALRDDPFKFIPLQWQRHPDNKLKSVPHLYGGFIYRTEALRSVGGFPKYLSEVGHREETDTTIRLWLVGYRLIINPAAQFFHFRAMSGGIRNWNRKEMYDHDDKEFRIRLEEYKKQYNYRGDK